MEDILHVFGVNWKLLGIQMFNFGILLYLLHRFLYKPIFAMLEERQAKLKKGLEDAALAEKARTTLEEEKHAVMQNARAQGDALITEFRSKAQTESQTIVHAAEDRAQKLIADGEKMGERRKDEIISQSKDELAKIAVKAAGEILKARKA